MKKNVAGQKLTVFAFDSTTNLPVTGDAANISAYVDKDDAGVNILADTGAAEISASLAAGYYSFDLAQAETNADKLMFTAKSTTSNVVVIGVPAVAYTTSVAPVSIDLSQVGLTPRDLGSVADGSITVGDCLVAAVCGPAGKQTIIGTTYTAKTPFTGTVIRSFTLDSGSAPTSRT